jgi:putative ABC transport system permease protein
LRPPLASVEAAAWRRRTVVALVLIVVAALTLIGGGSKLGALGAVMFLIGLVTIAPALVKPLTDIFSRLLELIYAREGTLARGNVERQPGRAAVTASTVMIALAIVIAASGLLSSIFAAFNVYNEKSLGSDFLVMPSSLVLSGGNLGASSSLSEKIRQTPGVAVLTTLRLAAATSQGKSLQMIGIDPITYPQVAGLVFSSGSEQTAFPALANGRQIIVNGIFAGKGNTRVGDVLTLETPEGPQDYTVSGVGMDFLNAKLATGYISQANLERDFHQTSDVMLMANLAAGANAGDVRSKLEAIVAAYPAFTLFDASEFRAGQKRTLDSISPIFTVMLLILVVPGLIAMVNTLAINVIERTREIGMVRAVGGTRRQIGRMIQAESLLLAALGTALGILAGLWLGYVLVGSVNMVGFVIEYSFPFSGILVAVAGGIILGVLAAAIPARQAARLDIIQALRYE